MQILEEISGREIEGVDADSIQFDGAQNFRQLCSNVQKIVGQRFGNLSRNRGDESIPRTGAHAFPPSFTLVQATELSGSVDATRLKEALKQARAVVF